MKKRVSIVALLLCFLMVVSTFVACQPAEDTSEASQSANASGSETSQPGWDGEKWVTNLPAFKWDVKSESFKTFDVLVYSNVRQTTYFSEEIGYGMYNTTDQVLTDAVMNRNNKVLEATGVEVKAHAVDDVMTSIRDDIATGQGKYDMAMPFMSGAAVLAQEQLVYALNDEMFADYLHLDMPWWDQSANEALSVDEKLFFTTGDISIMQKIVSTAVTFNKKMYADLYQGEKSMYQLVDDNEWTLDKMIELSKGAMLSADTTWDLTDRYGTVSAHSDANMLYLASGNNFCTKDGADFPVLSLNDEKSMTTAMGVVEKLITEGWTIHTEDMRSLGSTDIWVDSLNVFGNGNALFRTSAFSAIKKLRKYDDINFGIVPMPKYTADQENYYSPCSAHYAYGVVIPKNAADPEFSAYMTELLCCEAKNGITAAYYETTLKARDMRDDESARMLDLIFSNVVYDIGYIYNFGSVSTLLSGLANTGSTDIASSLESIQGEIESDINETIENFRS